MQQMGKLCCKMSGLAVLLAGLAFLAYGLGWWSNGMMVHLVSGALLAFYGLGMLMHAMDMCPNCEVMPPAKKR